MFGLKKVFQVEFDWFDVSSWPENGPIPVGLGLKHETFKINRDRTSVDEIYSLIKRNYPNFRNVTIKIVKG